jgi:ATP-dependent Lon protease
VEEIDSEFIKGIRFHFVKTMNQVLELALVD